MGIFSYMASWDCREKKIRAVLRKRLSTVFQNVKLMMIPVWRSLLELSCIAVKTSVGIQEYECPKTCYKSNKLKVLYHFYSGPDLKYAVNCKMAIVQETIRCCRMRIMFRNDCNIRTMLFINFEVLAVWLEIMI